MQFSGRNAAYYNAISRIAREEHGNDLNWLVTEKLNHLEQNEYSEKERAFLAKLILAEVLIWCAGNQFIEHKHGVRTVHGIITKWVVWNLQETGLPFKYPKVTGALLAEIEGAERQLRHYQNFNWRDMEQWRKTDFEITKAKHFGLPHPYDSLSGQTRISNYRADRNATPAFAEVEKFREDLIANQTAIVRALQAKIADDQPLRIDVCNRLMTSTQSRLQHVSAGTIAKRLLKWNNEFKVPNPYEVEYNKSIYSVNEIASINRNMETPGYIISKKAIREEIKKNPIFMADFVDMMRR